jgi:hypothetical protein
VLVSSPRVLERFGCWSVLVFRRCCGGAEFAGELLSGMMQPDSDEVAVEPVTFAISRGLSPSQAVSKEDLTLLWWELLRAC